ncbi:transcriptional regulator ArsR family [Candidatus Gastranaerophilus sp. (ex Termes propinquus)]|nr:transcriptional regulator ArsR family [Candidatus Gastranaerophilus sp. (ex Termes propinquus)]
MSREFYIKKTEIFKALANPVRLQIVDLLLDGEKCVCEIVEKLECEQPHVSKSLAKLKHAGLIKDRKEGLNVYYSLAICCMSEFFGCLNEIVGK